MIKRLTNLDIDILKDIETLELSTLGETLGVDSLKTYLDNPIKYIYAYFESNILVSYISFIFDGILVDINNFATKKEYQHKGYGSKLLNYALISCFKLKAKSATLEVRKSNIEAINIYTSFGFKQIFTRSNYYANGDDALLLELKFPNLDSFLDNYQTVFSKKEITKDYIKYSDEYQFDKYYNNFYKVENLTENVLNKIEKDNKRNYLSIVTFKQEELLKDFKLEVIENMMAFTKSIKIHEDKGNVVLLTSELKSEYIKLSTIEYQENLYEFAYKNAISFFNQNDHGNIKVFLIKKDDELIGQLHVYIKDGIAKIEDLFILEKYQKQGYGITLLKHAIDYIKSQNITFINISAYKDDTPKNIYYKLGFIDCLDTYFSRRGE